MLGQKYNKIDITNLGKKHFYTKSLGNKHMSYHRKPYNIDGIEDVVREEKKFKSYLEKR